MGVSKKLEELGTVTRNKARLVVQGYNKKEGINYEETFAPAARIEAIRILVAFAAHIEIKLYHCLLYTSPSPRD